MSETQETPQKIDKAACQEMDEEHKLNFKEFYPVNEPFGCVGVNIERKTSKLRRLTSARSSLAWVRLDAARTYPFEGKSASGSSGVFVPCAAVDSVISKEATVQEAL